MKPALCLTTLLAGVCLLWAAPSKDEATAFKDAVFEKCKKEENIPNNVVQDVYDLKSVEGAKEHKIGKSAILFPTNSISTTFQFCFMKCINIEYKILKEDGTMDEEKIDEAIKSQWRKPENQEKVIPVAKDCLEKVKKETESCEYSYNIYHCFLEGLKKVELSEE